MLELKEARKSLRLASGDGVETLRGVSLEVGGGESLAILGKSGSGKSTLLGLLGLLDSLDSGSYLVYGRETAKLSERELAALRGSTFGFVYQHFCLMGHLSAYENVEAPLLHSNMTRAARRKAAREALDRIGLGDRLQHRPAQLSGGEQQRVAIARALVRRPPVILADEPTGSLDATTGREVLSLMTQLVVEAGSTLVVVTHDTEIAIGLRRIVSLSDGVLREWRPADAHAPLDRMARSAIAPGP